MSRIPQRIKHLELKAEGFIILKGQNPIPYRADLAGPDGCSLHLWMGNRDQDKGLVYRARDLASLHRDVVATTFCRGDPEDFWEPPFNIVGNLEEE